MINMIIGFGLKGIKVRVVLILGLCASFGPKNTFSLQRLIVRERNGPVACIFPENLSEVVPRINIKRIVFSLIKEGLVIINAPSFAIPHHSLQRCCILQHHSNMHMEEHQQHNEQGDAEDESNESQSCMKVSSPCSLDNPCDFLYLNQHHLYDCNQNGEQQIEEKENEVLPIVKPYAVVDPRTVMVHVQHALSALRAMMRPFWFEVAADQAKFSLVRVAVVQAPEYRNLAWVSDYNCDKRPDAHQIEEGSDDYPSQAQLTSFSDRELVQIKQEDDKQSQ